MKCLSSLCTQKTSKTINCLSFAMTDHPYFVLSRPKKKGPLTKLRKRTLNSGMVLSTDVLGLFSGLVLQTAPGSVRGQAITVLTKWYQQSYPTVWKVLYCYQFSDSVTNTLGIEIWILICGDEAARLFRPRSSWTSSKKKRLPKYFPRIDELCGTKCIQPFPDLLKTLNFYAKNWKFYMKTIFFYCYKDWNFLCKETGIVYEYYLLEICNLQRSFVSYT